MEPKRAKRSGSNRQSTHTSRMKKLQHIHELEKHTHDASARLAGVQHELRDLAKKRAELLKSADVSRLHLMTLRQQLQFQANLQGCIQRETSRLQQLQLEQRQAQQPCSSQYVVHLAGAGGMVMQGGGMPASAPSPSGMEQYSPLRAAQSLSPLHLQLNSPQQNLEGLGDFDGYLPSTDYEYQ